MRVSFALLARAKLRINFASGSAVTPFYLLRESRHRRKVLHYTLPMKQSPHQYPLFSDLIEAQKKSVLSFFEKGILEEFELFSYVQGKNIAMIFHGSKFFLQKPLFSFEYLVESQKTYSVSLFIPVEFQALKGIGCSGLSQSSGAQTSSTEGSLQVRTTQSLSAGAEASVRLVGTPSAAIQEKSTTRLNLGKNIARRLAPWIYCGEIPFMTERGNFLINGSARVLVNQIVRCPSVYFKVRIDQKNRRTYIGSFLSEYGSWLRLETDYKNRLWVRIDKSERFSIYALLRALGFPETFLKYQLKYYSFLFASQDEYNESRTRSKAQARSGAISAKGRGEACAALPTQALELRSRPMERQQASIIIGTQPLPSEVPLQMQSFATTSARESVATPYLNVAGQASGVSTSMIANLQAEKVEEASQQYQFHKNDSKSSSSQLTPHTAVQSIWKKCNPNRWNSLHGCYTFVYTKFFHPKKYSIGSVGRGRLNKRLIAHNQKGRVEVERSSAGAWGATPAKRMREPEISATSEKRRSLRAGQGKAYAERSCALTSTQSSGAQASPLQSALFSHRASKTQVILKTDKKVNRLPTLTPEDIFMALDVLIRFHYGEGVLDDIDHLKNRRVRLPGELMQNQLRLALSRMTQASVDKLTNVAGTPLQSEGLEESSNASVGTELADIGVNNFGSETTVGQNKLSGDGSAEQEGHNFGKGRSYALRSLRNAANTGPSPRAGVSFGEAMQGQSQRHPQASTNARAKPAVHSPLAGRVSFAACIQTQVFSSTFKELFNTSQLSQYMDQTNPLAEITHKRRLSSLGPGGIAKDQAGVAVREIHPSHFGRICPIETPEGQNAGLVGSLATYCQLTSEGFLEAIYSRKSLKQHRVISAAKVGDRTAVLQRQGLVGVAQARGGAISAKGVATLCEACATPHHARQRPNHQRPDWFIFQADSEDEVFISAEQYRLTPGNVEESVQSEDKDPSGLNLRGQSRAEARVESAEAQPALTPQASQRRSLRKSVTNARANLGNSSQSKYTPIRYRQEFFRVNEVLVEFFGVSPIQMISLATSLIPFLEHDDANRALMGSNMQRQAVPLMTTERAYIGTGLEVQAARDSTTLCCTQVSGQVSWIDANHVVLQGNSYLTKLKNSHSPVADGAGAASQGRNFGKGRSYALRSLRHAANTGPSPPASLTSTSAHAMGSSHQKTPYHQSQWEYDLQKYWRSNQNTCIYQKPNYQHGAWIEKGRCIADGAASSYGEIALGKNIFVAYMPWEGFNFEDAIVINQRLVDEDIYTSIHIERYDIDVMDTEYGREILGRDLLNPRESHGIDPSKSYSIGRAPVINDLGVASPREAFPQPPHGKGEATNLDAQGIILPGTWVEEDDILVGKMTPIAPPKPTPEYRLLLAIFETKPLPFRDTSLRVPPGIQGRILECIVKYQPVRTSNDVVAQAKGGTISAKGVATLCEPYATLPTQATPQASPLYNQQKTSHTRGEVLSSRLVESVQVFLVSKRKIQLGDKMSGRHGNKGIVSCILPQQDMPFVQDGSPLDIVLNPLGVPSRMNVGQVLECLFGFASKMLCENYRLIPFDEIYGEEASRGLVYTKLFEASKTTGYEWIFDPNHPGKTHIFDGRTGEPFHQPVLVGYSYMLKLIHQVDEKMHARSTGPYSLITQQPLGGRAKHGGQRLGEMEVWACEGFGASAVLHEFLTLKSDDIDSRNTFLFHVMKRKSLGRTTEQRFHNKLTDRIGVLSAARTEAFVTVQATDGPGAASQERQTDAGPSPRYDLPQASPLLPNQVSQPTTVPESFRVLVHELQSLCLSVYFHPEFRLTYPSLLGWDGLFVLPSKSSS